MKFNVLLLASILFGIAIEAASFENFERQLGKDQPVAIVDRESGPVQVNVSRLFDHFSMSGDETHNGVYRSIVLVNAKYKADLAKYIEQLMDEQDFVGALTLYNVYISKGVLVPEYAEPKSDLMRESAEDFVKRGLTSEGVKFQAMNKYERSLFEAVRNLETETKSESNMRRYTIGFLLTLIVVVCGKLFI